MNMDIEKSLAQLYVFNDNATGTVGGLPLTEIIQQEQKKRSGMCGGNHYTTMDKFERLRDLVVPAGLYVQNYPSSHYKANDTIQTVPDELYNKLLQNVSNSRTSSMKSLNRTHKNMTSAGRKYTKKISVRA